VALLCAEFLPAGRALRARPAGPKITLLFLRLLVPYSSKFSWHNIFVIFVIDPSFTNFLVTKILISEGVAFSRAERVMHLH